MRYAVESPGVSFPGIFQIFVLLHIAPFPGLQPRPVRNEDIGVEVGGEEEPAEVRDEEPCGSGAYVCTADEIEDHQDIEHHDFSQARSASLSAATSSGVRCFIPY